MKVYLHIFVASIISFALFLNSCVMNKMDDSHQTIVLKSVVGAKNVTVSIRKGKHFSNRMQAGPVVFNVIPQIAVWAEKSDGSFIETLYVTGAEYKKMTHGGKKSKGAQFYREALPVWASRAEKAGKELPSDTNPYPDTVTSATPMSSFTIKTALQESEDTVVIFAEINKSADYNSRYTKELSDWAGQPSLIYKADIPFNGSAVVLKLAGHGGILDSDPRVHEDISSFDTAVSQIESIRVEVNP